MVEGAVEGAVEGPTTGHLCPAPQPLCDRCPGPTSSTPPPCKAVVTLLYNHTQL
jgi:hypothetical protein